MYGDPTDGMYIAPLPPPVLAGHPVEGQWISHDAIATRSSCYLRAARGKLRALLPLVRFTCRLCSLPASASQWRHDDDSRSAPAPNQTFGSGRSVPFALAVPARSAREGNGPSVGGTMATFCGLCPSPARHQIRGISQARTTRFLVAPCRRSPGLHLWPHWRAIISAQQRGSGCASQTARLGSPITLDGARTGPSGCVTWHHGPLFAMHPGCPVQMQGGLRQ